MRWEMRTCMFLRTSEFLWQEGHCAHATAEESEARTVQMIRLRRIRRKYMAMPVTIGVKTANERFAGAPQHLHHRSHDAGRQSLQAGTSHNLGQNFAKAFDVTFANRDNQPEYVWANSWGVSTPPDGRADYDPLRRQRPCAAAASCTHPGCYRAHLQKRRTAGEITEKVMPIVERLGQLGISVKFDDADNKRPDSSSPTTSSRGVPVRLVLGAPATSRTAPSK